MFAGYPRVLGLAWAFVAHTDSHFDAGILCRFVRAYQDVQPLTIGELWAVGITLRIVLVENLRRLADLIVGSGVARQQADGLADRLLGAGDRVAEPASVVLKDLQGTTLRDAFAVQLVHRLRDQDPRITPALTWLDQHLAAQGTTADTVVRDEHQAQGAATVTVRNIITSMRVISDVDWPDLFERISLVDGLLAGGGAFREMDFPTRNLYRSAIEELARGSNRTELDVAARVVRAARPELSASTAPVVRQPAVGPPMVPAPADLLPANPMRAGPMQADQGQPDPMRVDLLQAAPPQAAATSTPPIFADPSPADVTPADPSVEQVRRADPGYHLLAGGRGAFETAIGYRPPISAWAGRLSRTFGIRGYVAAGGAIAAILLAIPLLIMHAQGMAPLWLSLFGVLGAIPAIDAAVALVNRALTRGFGATLLPALELRTGVPAQLRTVIAVPTLLTTTKAIESQIERLEIHHLASPEGDLHFVLLSDWLDAATEHTAGDAGLLETAIAGIARLNRRYGPAPGG